jgi:hypothetical protein
MRYVYGFDYSWAPQLPETSLNWQHRPRPVISFLIYIAYKEILAKCQGLTPITLATQEAEIRRIVV